MPTRSSLNDTARETVHFFRQGKTVEQIAIIRGLKESTIYSHLEDAIRAGEKIELERLLDEKGKQEICRSLQAARFRKSHRRGGITWGAATHTVNCASTARPPAARSGASAERRKLIPDRKTHNFMCAAASMPTMQTSSENFPSAEKRCIRSINWSNKSEAGNCARFSTSWTSIDCVYNS